LKNSLTNQSHQKRKLIGVITLGNQQMKASHCFLFKHKMRWNILKLLGKIETYWTHENCPIEHKTQKELCACWDGKVR